LKEKHRQHELLLRLKESRPEFDKLQKIEKSKMVILHRNKFAKRVLEAIYSKHSLKTSIYFTLF